MTSARIRHIVLVTFKPEVTEDERATYRRAVEKMASDSPQVRTMTCGMNVGNGPNHHDFAVVMDFDDMAAFRRYIESPAHAAYVKDVGPMVARLAAIQHEL